MATMTHRQDVLPWLEQAILDYAHQTYRPTAHYRALFAGARDEITRLRRQQTMDISLGRTVHYVLTADDVTTIIRRRSASYVNDAPLFYGNAVIAGDICSMVVVRLWPNPGNRQIVNGRVLLDGNDVLWVTSVEEGTAPGQWFWPPRA
jgi:hypothetical protein